VSFPSLSLEGEGRVSIGGDMSLTGVYLSVHTPRYCTLEAAFEGKLASEVFRPVRDGLARAAEPEMGGRHLAMMLGSLMESGERFEATVHAYGPSSGSGNYVISFLAHEGSA
jgi:hypothetical protein